MSKIELECTWCKVSFLKEVKEYKCRLKKNPSHKFFCSLSCSMKQVVKNNPHMSNIENIPIEKRKNPGSSSELSPFNFFVNKARARSKIKKQDFDLTPQYLKEIWDSQKGKCPLSNVNMNLAINTSIGFENSSPYNASLDRIDNSKGYIKGNVRFICLMANIGRNEFSDSDLIDFCKKATAFQKSKKGQNNENF